MPGDGLGMKRDAQKVTSQGGISTYHLSGTCHFTLIIGTHNFVNSEEFLGP